jgi:hypothetical protein
MIVPESYQARRPPPDVQFFFVDAILIFRGGFGLQISAV